MRLSRFFCNICLMVGALFLLYACSPTIDIHLDDPIIEPPVTMLEGGKTHFRDRIAEIEVLPRLEGGVLMAGDSITEGWLGHSDKLPFEVSNHGVGWDTAEGLQSRLPLILKHSPDHIFLMIGTNDIGYGHQAETVASHVEETIKALQREKPDTKIYIQAILPREREAVQRVKTYNQALEKVAERRAVRFIDMSGGFATPDDVLKAEYTDDGLHLNARGYEVWAQYLTDIIKMSSN